MGPVAAAPRLQSTTVVYKGLVAPRHVGDLPGSGIEPMSPASAGRFFTTEPPGKPNFFDYLYLSKIFEHLLYTHTFRHICSGLSMILMCLRTNAL